MLSLFILNCCAVDVQNFHVTTKNCLQIILPSMLLWMCQLCPLVCLPKSDHFLSMIYNLEIKNNVFPFVRNVVLLLGDIDFIWEIWGKCFISVGWVASGQSMGKHGDSRTHPTYFIGCVNKVVILHINNNTKWTKVLGRPLPLNRLAYFSHF